MFSSNLENVLKKFTKKMFKNMKHFPNCSKTRDIRASIFCQKAQNSNSRAQNIFVSTKKYCQGPKESP